MIYISVLYQIFFTVSWYYITFTYEVLDHTCAYVKPFIVSFQFILRSYDPYMAKSPLDIEPVNDEYIETKYSG